MLNVALGGTLVQHIEDHRFVHHAVTLEPGSLAAAAVGQHAPVGHSVHHQAIDRLGAGLVVSGRADDGTIEAVELPGRWVLGVQWHPEDTAADDPDQQRLFDSFVAAAGGPTPRPSFPTRARRAERRRTRVRNGEVAGGQARKSRATSTHAVVDSASDSRSMRSSSPWNRDQYVAGSSAALRTPKP